MLWLFKIIIFGHVHKWKEVSREKLTVHTDNPEPNTGVRVYTVCEKCGAQRKWDLA